MQTFEIPEDASVILPSGLTFGPDGRLLIVATDPPQVLDTAAGRWLAPLDSDHADVQFVPGGKAIACLDYVTHLAVVNLATRKVRRRYELPQASGRGLAATPDGKTLFLLAHLFDGPAGAEVWRFDAATLKRRGKFAQHKFEPWEMVGSADGRRLATGGVVRSETIRVWDTTDTARRAVAITPKGRVAQFALSADGGHLAIVGTRGVTLWNAATGREVWASGKHRRSVTAVCFSPTRPLLATGDGAGNVFLWDFAGRVLTRYDWGLGGVYALAFAPDGLRCAAVDGSGKVVVWDVDV